MRTLPWAVGSGQLRGLANEDKATTRHRPDEETHPIHTNQGPLLAIPVLLPQGSSTQGLAAGPPEARMAWRCPQAPLWRFQYQQPMILASLSFLEQVQPSAVCAAVRLGIFSACKRAQLANLALTF